MSNLIYSIKSLNFNRNIGNNTIPTVTIKQKIMLLEGVIVPYTFPISSLVKISNGSGFHSMHTLTAPSITLTDDDAEVSDINMYGGIVNAFRYVSNIINDLPPAVVVNLTASEFGFVNTPVIFFNKINADLKIVYPFSTMPNDVHTYFDENHYIWYIKKIPDPAGYRIGLENEGVKIYLD